MLIDVEKFFYIRGMDYIPTFKRGERFNDNYYEFVKGLGVELEKEGYIKECIQNKWMYIFSDLETFEGEETLEWLKAKNHCIYLIDSLVDEKVILGGLKNKIDSKIERFFKIKNVAQTRYSYFPNKPKGGEQIDYIILRVLNSL